ncbi:hypothetical protein HRW14_21825 [Streptomyces lunaelactis]|uniref:hypothetical protein n=1 Tax=Streptomyces lunaelactis TaxID=1535768 RepID=UPI001584D0A8|nr:hypothetical protein [Streptomyces lunaelactis]NUK52871.1 hypothetical protein [Streptomyces lunaelactis]NUK67479.1 hypothetical protein [Streptomyces lunaelactis]
MDQQQQYRQGERVEYLNRHQETCQGMVQGVMGTGQQSTYAIKNEYNHETEEVSHNRVRGHVS